MRVLRRLVLASALAFTSSLIASPATAALPAGPALVLLDADDATLASLAAVDADVAHFATIVRTRPNDWDSGVVTMRGLSVEQVGRLIRQEELAAASGSDVRLAYQLIPDGAVLRVRVTPFELRPGTPQIVDLEYRREAAGRMRLAGWRTH